MRKFEKNYGIILIFHLTLKIMQNLLLLLLSFILFQSCINNTVTSEDPHQIAKAYCDCIKNQFTNAKDSSLDIKECENKIYHTSRLLTIYLDFENLGNYSDQTRDSAIEFAVKVRDIEDTLCVNKIDFKKIKPVR